MSNRFIDEDLDWLSEVEPDEPVQKGHFIQDPVTGQMQGSEPGPGHGGGERQHPGKGYSASAWEDKNGVIHTSNVYDATRALSENRKVELNQPKQVSTLLHHLGQV